MYICYTFIHFIIYMALTYNTSDNLKLLRFVIFKMAIKLFPFCKDMDDLIQMFASRKTHTHASAHTLALSLTHTQTHTLKRQQIWYLLPCQAATGL